MLWRQQGNFEMPYFSPLSGRTRCPAALSGARRPVATAVVKNPFVADSSSEKSSCGDNKEILRCTISPLSGRTRYPAALGSARRCPGVRCPWVAPLSGPAASHLTPPCTPPPGVRHLGPRLSGRPRCPAVLGGARRPVGAAVVKNLFCGGLQ